MCNSWRPARFRSLWTFTHHIYESINETPSIFFETYICWWHSDVPFFPWKWVSQGWMQWFFWIWFIMQNYMTFWLSTRFWNFGFRNWFPNLTPTELLSHFLFFDSWIQYWIWMSCLEIFFQNSECIDSKFISKFLGRNSFEILVISCIVWGFVLILYLLYNYKLILYDKLPNTQVYSIICLFYAELMRSFKKQCEKNSKTAQYSP